MLCLALFLVAGASGRAYAVPEPVAVQGVQQARTVKGMVVDEMGEPIIGANIKVEGTTTGVISDLDGNFIVNVPTNGKLIVSFIGYITQTVALKGNDVKVVLKEDAQSLEEVVVVGYATQKMKNVTGAITTVNTNDISNLPTGDLGSSLKGFVPGLSISGGEARPGTPATLNIRNALSNAKNASTDPLYVIDDIVVSSQEFSNLNPNDIEHMSVLKDGAAAVYGASAGTGAILIKTKRGKEGAPKVTYTGQFGYFDELSRPKMLSAYEYGVFYNRYHGPEGLAWSSKKSNLKTNFFQSDELAVMQKLNYDWLDEAWSSSGSMNHNVNISGGTKTATYYGSMSYFTQDGNLGTVDYDRWNYRAGVDVNLVSHFKVGLQLSGEYSNRKTVWNKIGTESEDRDYSTLLTTPRYMPAYIDGNPLLRYGVTNKQEDNLSNYNYFALQDYEDYKSSRDNSTRVNATAEYDFDWSKLLKGLKLKFVYSKNIDNHQANFKGTKLPMYYYANGVRSGSGNHLYETDWQQYAGVLASDQLQYAGTMDNNMTTTSISNSNRMMRDFSRADNYQMNFIASYGRTFGNHAFNGLFSIERMESDTEDSRFMKDNPLPFGNGQSTSATGTIDGTAAKSVSGKLSYIGRINYSYLDRYLLEFLVRSDASTKFAPENYWGVFPSFSAGWVVSEESFFKDNIQWMDFLKLRASYGRMGRDGIAAWQWAQFYDYDKDKGAIFGTNTTSAIPWSLKLSSAPNRDMRWDRMDKYNVGVETRFLDGRLSFGVDAFLTKNIDVLYTRTATVPVTVGGALAPENYERTDVYGVELSLGWRDRIQDVNYHVSLNSGWNDGRYRKRDWPDIIALGDPYPDGPIDMGAWGYDCLGMFRSQEEIDEYVKKYNITKVFDKDVSELKPGMLYYRDVRGNQKEDGSYDVADGIISKNDRIQLSKKKTNPYGFTINMGGDWKGLSLTAQLSTSWGGFAEVPSEARTLTAKQLEFTNVPSFWNDMFSLEEVKDEQGNVITVANPTGKYPNMSQTTYNNETSTFWQISSFRMQLRTLALGYTLPKQWIKPFGIENCKLTLTGRNLLSFTNPYPDSYMDSMMTSYNVYPTLRSFNMGVNVTF